jgi:hypothetical protein
MGALNEQITVESQMQGDATARQQKRKETVDSEIVTRKRAEVRQYALYLMSRGAFGGQGQPHQGFGVIVAIGRGRQEQITCEQTLGACFLNGQNCSGNFFPAMCAKIEDCHNPSQLLPFPYGH